MEKDFAHPLGLAAYGVDSLKLKGTLPLTRMKAARDRDCVG